MSLTLRQSRSADPRHIEIVRRLLQRLMAMYGSKFADAYGDVPLVALEEAWSDGITDYSLDELARGVSACKALKWPPTMPEFLLLSRPAINAEVAFAEALDFFRLRYAGRPIHLSSPAIFYAALHITVFDMRRLGYLNLRDRWRVALDAELAKGAWPPIPPPPVALIDSRPPTPMPPHVRASLDRLTLRLQGKPDANPDATDAAV